MNTERNKRPGCPCCGPGRLLADGSCDFCTYVVNDEDTFNGKGIEVTELRLVDDKPTDPYNTARS